jgi:hypothetical protein
MLLLVVLYELFLSTLDARHKHIVIGGIASLQGPQ